MITEFSCIGIKYFETIFGANSKATAAARNEKRIKENDEWLGKLIINNIIDLLSWLKEAQRMGHDDDGDDEDDDDDDIGI